jgi:hypothetical protein
LPRCWRSSKPGSPAAGLSAWRRSRLCRLRQALARTIGKRAAEQSIETSGGGQYALSADWGPIAVAPEFRTCVLRASTLNRRRAAILKLL